MAENTKIEWATHTFNPWEGCQKVGPGCDHCYAETRNARFGGGTAANWGPGAPRRRTSAANWRKPLAWDLAAAGTGVRPRVFCASLADVFDNAVDPEWRADLFKLIRSTPNLDWLLLTKRVGNARDMLPDGWTDEPEGHWPNVWIGATIVNQAEADRDIPKLLAVPAAKRFLSMEPLLGPVDLTDIAIGNREAGVRLNAMTGGEWDDLGHRIEHDPIDWVIVGGESGAGARPMHPDWARALRDQCADFDVPFLFKQWGEWVPDAIGDRCVAFRDGRNMPNLEPHGSNGDGTVRIARLGKVAAGRHLDGALYDGVPA